MVKKNVRRLWVIISIFKSYHNLPIVLALSEVLHERMEDITVLDMQTKLMPNQ